MREKLERRSIRRDGRPSGFSHGFISDGRWRTSVSAQNRETARASSEKHRKGTLLIIGRRNHHPQALRGRSPLTLPRRTYAVRRDFYPPPARELYN